MNTDETQSIKEYDSKYYIHTFSGEKNYNPVITDKAEGSYIYSYDGKKYLDFASQLVCVNLGNKNEEINNKVIEAINRYGFLSENFLTKERAMASKQLIEDIPGVNDWAGKVKFFNSGSEAIEAAINLARLITGKQNVLVKDYDFHGWTGEALQATRVTPFGGMKNLINNELSTIPDNGNFCSLPSPYCYKCQYGKTYEDCKKESVLWCVKKSEEIINEIGPSTIAAFLSEIVSGFGMVFPPEEYFVQMRELMNKYGILWIDDEILTGFGRLGKWFAYELYDGVYPDIMCVGKGLNNAVIPSSAIVVSKEIAKTLEDRIWYVGSTYSGHPAAVAAISETIRFMIDNNIVDKVEEKSNYLKAKLKGLQEKYSFIDAIFGAGLFWLIEFRRDDNSRSIETPNGLPIVKQLIAECYKAGLILGGMLPYTVRLAPSLVTSEEDIDKAIKILETVLSRVGDIYYKD